MKLIILFALSVIASLCSFIGEARADIARVYLLNSEMRYERNSDQELVDRRPLNVSVGYQYTRWSALLEYVSYKENSGNATTSFDRRHQELMAWARYHAFAWTFGQNQHTVQAYAGAGGGTYQESVTTRFMTESRSDDGKYIFMSGLSLGGEYSLRLTDRILLSTALEGRALVSSDLDPNPMWTAVLRVGLGVFL